MQQLRPAPSGAFSPTSTEASVDSSAPILRRSSESWPTFGTKDESPGWLKDNDYIIGAHAMPTYSYKGSFRLWGCLHMETMNIWTHLVGGAAFITAEIAMYKLAVSKSLGLTIGDRFSVGMSLTSGALCFALSTTFHTLRSHSYSVHHFWGRLDMVSAYSP